MADNFPIDIDYKKVNDWLYDRKKLPKDWAAKHKALGLKLSDLFAKASVEDKDVKKYMKDNEEKANFLILNKTIEKVLETEEGKAKNMFGRYTSKNVNDLVALKKLYEKDGLHIADMAKILAQNGAFEIPAIKKNITTFEHQIQDLIQEEQSYKNSIAFSEREFANYCEKLGISGEDINKEVPALIHHLPAIFDKFVEAIKSPLIRETLDYYYNFTRYVNPKQDEERLKLHILEYLHNKGDDLVEVFQLTREKKQIPEHLRKENENKYSRYQTDKKNKKDEAYHPQIIEIGGSQIQEVQKEAGGIDWGAFDLSAQPTTTLETAKSDYGFEVIDEGKSGSEDSDVITKDTLLSNFDTRNQILANLEELRFFIQQRFNETGASAGNTILQAYEQGENSAIFEVSKEKLTQILELLNRLTEIVSDFKARQYFILKEQPKASERIINHLNQFKLNANKARDGFSGLSKRNYDINKAIKENKEIHDELVKQTAELKSATEAEMKKLIKRDVFVIGDINKVLSGK